MLVCKHHRWKAVGICKVCVNEGIGRYEMDLNVLSFFGISMCVSVDVRTRDTGGEGRQHSR